MNGSWKLMLNGSEMFAGVKEVRGGLRLELDAADWRGLGLRPFDRLRMRRGSGDEWFFVVGVGIDGEVARVSLADEWEGKGADPTIGTPLARGVLPKPAQPRVQGVW